MRTALSKGLSAIAALMRHGLRNALTPVVTLLGLQARRTADRRDHHRDDFFVARDWGGC